MNDGDLVGANVGRGVGTAGAGVGRMVGSAVGSMVGGVVGSRVGGLFVGETVGLEGEAVGVGMRVGAGVGLFVGALVGATTGALVGALVGATAGALVGDRLGLGLGALMGIEKLVPPASRRNLSHTTSSSRRCRKDDSTGLAANATTKSKNVWIFMGSWQGFSCHGAMHRCIIVVAAVAAAGKGAPWCPIKRAPVISATAWIGRCIQKNVGDGKSEIVT